MNSREAKDFLVEQVLRQAPIESVPLSDIEKRMMYFTEGSDAVEDPVSLSEEFGEQCNTAEYEAKISRLLKHARGRVKAQKGADWETWNEAVAVLREGDHYILVMLGGMPWAAIARLWIRVLAPLAFVVVVVLVLRRRFGPLPRVSPYVYFGLFLALYLVGVLWSRQPSAKPRGRVFKAVIHYFLGKW